MGQIGLGVLYTIALGDISGTAYAYIPLFSYDESGAALIVDSVANPCQIGLRITSPDLIVINTDTGSISFSAIDLAGFVYLNPAAYETQSQYVTLTFETSTGTDRPSVYTSLASMLDNQIEPWLLQVAVQSGAWLNTYLGSTTFTVGNVLEAAAILAQNYLFASANILEPAALTSLLTSSTPDPVSADMWPLFPAADQAVLNDSNATPDQQTAALIDGFNTVLQVGLSIYDETLFAGIALSPQTTTLLSQNPTGDQLVKLNRLLLDDAYVGNVQEIHTRSTWPRCREAPARLR